MVEDDDGEKANLHIKGLSAKAKFFFEQHLGTHSEDFFAPIQEQRARVMEKMIMQYVEEHYPSSIEHYERRYNEHKAEKAAKSANRHSDGGVLDHGAPEI